jgi:Na+/H+-translocating membrane pyrophosphatase
LARPYPYRFRAATDHSSLYGGHQASAAALTDTWHQRGIGSRSLHDAAGPTINPLIRMCNIVAIMIIAITADAARAVSWRGGHRE